MNIESKLNISLSVWISFKRNSSILCVNLDSKTDFFFQNRGLYATYCSVHDEQLDIQKENKYDYILGVNILESVSTPEAAFTKLKSFLKPNGLMYIGPDDTQVLIDYINTRYDY